MRAEQIASLITKLCDRIFPGETDEQMAESILAICLIKALARLLITKGDDQDLVTEVERFLA